MRTTVTLDHDVEQLLRDEMRRQNRSFKEALNQAVRKALAGDSGAQEQGPFALQSRSLGLRPGYDPLRLVEYLGEEEEAAFLSVAESQGRRSTP